MPRSVILPARPEPVTVTIEGTALDQVLVARRIRTLLVCGVATDVGVESTIRDACHREDVPVMLADAATAAGPGTQPAAEFNMQAFFGWLTTGAGLRAALMANEAPGPA